MFSKYSIKNKTLGHIVSIIYILSCFGGFMSPVSCTVATETCATLYSSPNYQGQNYSVGDGKQFTNLEEEYITSSDVWNVTTSFTVHPGCLFTACNESYFDGICQEFKESATTLPITFSSVQSVNCTCAKDCRCSSIYMKRNGCARAYLQGGCNTCNAYYTDLRGSKEFFPAEFENKVSAILVRPGCSLTIYEEENYGGESNTYEDIVENWSKDDVIGSYECTCSEESMQLQARKPRPAGYPDFIEVPKTVDEISKMVNGKIGRHPALIAALKSLKHKRSPRNAYILIMGISGSGKSSAINLLFDNPNVTTVGSDVSITNSIHEFRIPVPVDELGISNSELRVIDTPGLADTKGLEQDAKFLATLEEYLDNHEELHNKIPNVVLIFHKFHDNRFGGEGSAFVKVLRGLDSFRPRITDKEYSNVIFVLTHFTSETKETARRPKVKLASFKKIIEDYSLFPRPITIAVAENKAAEQELPLVNGYYRLPNGDYYPRNLFEKIQLVTTSGGDPVGEAVITAAFRDSDDFNISSITTSLVGSVNAKVSKYLSVLLGAIVNVENTTISQMLSTGYESLDTGLKKKFPDALPYLQKALSIRNIRQTGDIPRTTFHIVELLTSLKLNEANLYLLEKGLSLKPPILKENPVTGYSYNVFKDMPLPISPLKLGEMKNSDIGYTFPAVMSCIVERKETELLKIFENRQQYLDYRLQSLNIGGKIPLDKFIGVTRPGSNIKSESTGNGSRITAVREFRNFELLLNDRLDLTPEFIKSLKLLNTFNETDIDSVESWKNFFNEYGTHVVQSVHGGGAIEIHLSSDNQFGPEIAEALYDLVQFAEDVSVGKVSNATLERAGVTHVLKFRGGDHAFHTSDLTKMSLTAAAELLEKWKDSLSLNPTILTSEIRLLPISELAKKVGQNISSEIQRATELLFDSSLKYQKPDRPKESLPGSAREDTSLQQNAIAANSMYMDILTKMMEASRKSDERFQQMMVKMDDDRKRSEEKRDQERREQLQWEREQQAIREKNRREDVQNAHQLEIKRQEMQHQFQMAQKEAEERRREQEQQNIIRMEAMQAEQAKQYHNAMVEMAKRPTGGGGGGCLKKGTVILMADWTEQHVEKVQVGDMVMDHKLQPTRVIGAMEKFLLHDAFLSFSPNGPYFFTTAHMVVGPGDNPTESQIWVNSLESLLAENPLMEKLGVKEFNQNVTTPIFRVDEYSHLVVVEDIQAYPDVIEYPPETLVHLLEVDSPHGTYFANGYACHHEIPPIEHWPNTGNVVLGLVGFHDMRQKVESLPYTLESVIAMDEFLTHTCNNLITKLQKFSKSPSVTSKLVKSTESKSNPVELIADLFINPMYSNFIVGLYGKCGKELANVLDNTAIHIEPEELESLSLNLVETVVSNFDKSLDLYFSR